MIKFAYPSIFILLALPIIFRKFMPMAKGMHGDALDVPFSFMNAIKNITSKSGFTSSSMSNSTESSFKLISLYIIWTILVITVARPQLVGEPIPLRTHNREILFVLDISNSMLEPDFKFNNKRIDRLTIVKKTISDFIKKRTDDKMGLILFGSNAYLQAPITFDKKSVEEILWNVDAGMAGNSTAIGDALGLALKTLRQSGDLDKKIIILLTDGESNDGSLNLAEAISLARKEGIKIYTIGVGTEGSLVRNMFGFNLKLGSSGLDEKSLKEIADATKGNYFKASDTESLERIYKEIDKLEPNIHEDIHIQEIKELYHITLALALIISSILIFVTRRKLS